ncbi:MAG TPA: hypothetical protein VJA94_20985, partial [Candidatus Angelobacter sp.]
MSTFLPALVSLLFSATSLAGETSALRKHLMQLAGLTALSNFPQDPARSEDWFDPDKLRQMALAARP